jgi:hypothetical protein
MVASASVSVNGRTSIFNRATPLRSTALLGASPRDTALRRTVLRATPYYHDLARAAIAAMRESTEGELNLATEMLASASKECAELTAERDRRAALEEMLIIKPRDEAEAAFHRIARRALEVK